MEEEREEVMTRDEMLSRLKAGEHPIDISIDKWVRLNKAWKIDPMSSSRAKIYSDTCALCEAARHKVTGELNCKSCILYRLHNQCNEESSWRLAKESNNAMIMVLALRQAKKHLMEGGEYDIYLAEHKKVADETPKNEYHIGMKFHKEGGDNYLLAFHSRNNENDEDVVALFNMDKGTQWSGQHSVVDSDHITEEEMDKVFSCAKGEFELFGGD